MTVDDVQDFKRLWPLKLVTAIWLTFALACYLYLAFATWAGTWPFGQTAWSSEFSIWPSCYAAGGIGATSYAMRGFYQAAGPRRADEPRYHYDPNWTWWYVLRPVMGGVVGVVGYVAVRVLLTPLDVPRPQSESAYLSFSAIAFFAGYSLTQLFDWLRQAAAGVFR